MTPPAATVTPRNLPIFLGRPGLSEVLATAGVGTRHWPGAGGHAGLPCVLVGIAVDGFVNCHETFSRSGV